MRLCDGFIFVYFSFVLPGEFSMIINHIHSKYSFKFILLICSHAP